MRTLILCSRQSKIFFNFFLALSKPIVYSNPMLNNMIIPNSPRVAVHYTRGGVNYVANIVRPINKDALVLAMLARKVGLSQITDIKPAQAFNR